MVHSSSDQIYGYHPRSRGGVRLIVGLVLGGIASYFLGAASPKGESGSGSLPIGTGAVCVDGTYSSSTGPGTCSHHGGIHRYVTQDVPLRWPANPKEARQRQFFFIVGHVAIVGAGGVLLLGFARRRPSVTPASLRAIVSAGVPTVRPPLPSPRKPSATQSTPQPARREPTQIGASRKLLGEPIRHWWRTRPTWEEVRRQEYERKHPEKSPLWPYHSEEMQRTLRRVAWSEKYGFLFTAPFVLVGLGLLLGLLGLLVQLLQSLIGVRP